MLRKISSVSIACLGLIMLVQEPAFANTTGKVFVAGDGSGNVVVIDAHSNAVITNISTGVGTKPHNLVHSADNQYVYVTLKGTDQVAKINAVTNTVVDTFSSYGVAPVHLEVSPDGGSLYVVNQKDDEVVKINAATGALEATYSLANAGDNTSLNLIKPHDINIGPDGKLWVTDELQNTISLIDTSLTGVFTTIGVGDRPIQVAFSVDGSQAFVTNYNDNTVSVLNVGDGINAGTYGLGTTSFDMSSSSGLMGPMGVVVDPDGSRLWLSGTAGDTVHAHDLLASPIGSTHTETTGLLGAHGLDISDDGNFLYTSVRYDTYSTGRDAVAVIDASNGSVLTTLSTPGATDLHGVLYVSAIPVPAAVWLFGSGLLGLVGVAHREKKKVSSRGLIAPPS